MKILAATAAALIVTGAAQAQTVPAAPTRPSSAPASDLTRELNSGPPTRGVTAAPPTTAAPSPATPVVRPATLSAPVLPSSGPTVSSPAATPSPATPIPATPVPQPRTAPIASAVVPAPVTTAPPPAAAIVPVATPPSSNLPSSGPVPRTQPPATGPAVVAPPVGSAPAASPVPAPAPAAVPPPPSVPTITVLDAATRAALPFAVTLPPGFEIVTGRPGPDFRIYTIRRGEQSFVMVYAGPASQFPIYSGQMVEAGGRASIVSTEEGVGHAMEHLFQRPDAPREVHVWTMSLDGGDRALAEQIAQSVDIR